MAENASPPQVATQTPQQQPLRTNGGANQSRRPTGGASGAQQPVMLNTTNGSRPATIYAVPPVQLSSAQPTANGYYINYKTPANPIAHVQAARQQSAAQSQPQQVLLIGYPNGSAAPSRRTLTLGELVQVCISDVGIVPPPGSIPTFSVEAGPTTAATHQPQSETQNPRASPPMTRAELLKVKTPPPTHAATPTPPKTPPQVQALAPPPPPNSPQPGKLSQGAAIYQSTASGITPTELENMRTGTSPLKRFLPGLRKHIPPTIKAYPGLKEVTLYDFEKEQVVLETFKNERHYARGHYCFRALHDIRTGKTTTTTISLSRFTTPRSSPQVQGPLNTPEPSDSGQPAQVPNASKETMRVDLTLQEDFPPPARKNTASSITAATEKLTCQSPTPPPSADEKEPITIPVDSQNLTITPSEEKPDKMDLDSHDPPPRPALSSSTGSEPDSDCDPTDSFCIAALPPPRCRYPGLKVRNQLQGTRSAHNRDFIRRDPELARRRKMASHNSERERNRGRLGRKSRALQASST